MMTTHLDLEKPAPKGSRIECFIKKDPKESAFHLFLEQPPYLVQEKGQYVLAAKQLRRKDARTEYTILPAAEFSRDTDAYLGNVLESHNKPNQFMVYTRRSSAAQLDASGWLKGTDQVSPANSAGFNDLPIEACFNMARAAHELNFFCVSVFGTELISPKFLKSLKSVRSSKIAPEEATGHGTTSRAAQISYHANFCDVLTSPRDIRGSPRKFDCTLFSVPNSNGSKPENQKTLDYIEPFYNDESSRALASAVERSLQTKKKRLIIFRTKAPSTLEKDRSLYLQFDGRATIYSAKNFQLAVWKAAEGIPEIEQGKVVLQLGKVGKDKFSMDFCYPFSAVLAFGVCLSTLAR